MSVISIRAALETELAAMDPAMPTGWENMPVIPEPGDTDPFQIATMLLADPADDEIGATRYTEQGLFQISLFYPTITAGAGVAPGPGAAYRRALLVRQAFRRGRTLVADGLSVNIKGTPKIGPGFEDGARYVLPVRISFTCQVAA
jgi:hypothetical protein